MIKRILIILIAIAIMVFILGNTRFVPPEVWAIVEEIWGGINDWLDSVAGISFREIIISIVDIFVAIFEAFINVIRWLVDKI
jgi:hypothetical protein